MPLGSAWAVPPAAAMADATVDSSAAEVKAVVCGWGTEGGVSGGTMAAMAMENHGKSLRNEGKNMEMMGDHWTTLLKLQLA